MNTFRIFMTVLYVLGVISAIYMIGEPRKPITRGAAVFNTVFSAVIIYWLWSL